MNIVSSCVNSSVLVPSSIPCITTDTAGCRDVVSNNNNGFLVAIKSPEEIASRIEEIVSNKDIYLKMSKKSRLIAEKKFNQNIIIKQTLSIYGSH